MEGLNNEAQWILLLGFLMSICIITAVILVPRPICPDPRTNSIIGSTFLIGDVRDCVIKIARLGDDPLLHEDMSMIMLAETQASVSYEVKTDNNSLSFSFQNGVISYEENRRV